MNILDLIIAILLMILFIALLAFNYQLFGSNEPLLYLPNEFMFIVDVLPWILFALFVFDIYLKYKKSKDRKYFVKKYWLDIVMTALFPVFSIFKFIKFGFKVYKMIKIAKIGKIGTKVIIGIKKLFKRHDKLNR